MAFVRKPVGTELKGSCADHGFCASATSNSAVGPACAGYAGPGPKKGFPPKHTRGFPRVVSMQGGLYKRPDRWSLRLSPSKAKACTIPLKHPRQAKESPMTAFPYQNTGLLTLGSSTGLRNGLMFLAYLLGFDDPYR